jgi:hypothetical protein
LAECETLCALTPPVSYNCVSGTCVDPGDGTGTYADLASCEAACPVLAWECLGNPLGCVNVGSGGTYVSYAQCLLDCSG